MPRINATASAVVDAAPATVYGIIADYRNEHPHILPPTFFRNLTAERGGVGAGTRIRFEMTAFGKTRTVWGDVTEPEPGRVLVETYPETATETTFIVDPIDGGRSAKVTIVTAWTRPGLQGLVEQVLAPRLLRKVYAEELALLAQRARLRSQGPVA